MKTEFEELNNFYKPICERAKAVCNVLKADGFNAVSAFYNGHFVKDGDIWVEEFFPIPVVSVSGLCDIEIHSDKLTVSAKLKRNEALAFDYSLLDGIKFEMYGVENYLDDIYDAEIPLKRIKENIEKSGEEEIGFSFCSNTADDDAVLKIIEFIKDNGFYY